jgi:hypothetical protein
MLRKFSKIINDTSFSVTESLGEAWILEKREDREVELDFWPNGRLKEVIKEN